MLDLRTLGWALFNESRGLDAWCEYFNIEGKENHKPTGHVTLKEISYCRQDVRCSVNVLNRLKAEFDRHPVKLHPDKAVSPASIGKGYLKAMGIIPPKEKFNVPDEIVGITAQPFHGGRAEVKIRNMPVPCVLTDFSSQYPLVQSLLKNQDVFTAESVTFEDATQDVRKLLERITPECCFNPESWPQFGFFALIRPNNDILPVRAEYDGNGVIKNIGINYFTSEIPIYYSGPDVIASKILTGKVPHIERAIRMVPHGQQKGLKPVLLRGMVEIDPRKDDIFRLMVEQKQLYKESDEALSYFLKICANGTSYGIWFEVTPQKLFKSTKIKLFSGEHSHEQFTKNIERHGEWYFPPLASLITGGAHLLLAMIEKCIADKGGQYLFMDTDSVCIVASRNGRTLKTMKDLSWKDVKEIAKRFEKLNIYDKKIAPGSVLKIEKVNFDNKTKNQRQLYGYAISTKRYALYTYDSRDNVVVQEAKAHGLGYLYPPKDHLENEQEQDWIKEIWYWILQNAGIVRQGANPEWFRLPAMMRVAITTPAVFSMVKKRFVRPFNFVHMPQVLCDPGDESRRFTLVMPFSTDRERWLKTKAFDVRNGKEHSISLLTVSEEEPEKIEVASYGNVASTYIEHPEGKFLDRNGEPCSIVTQGLLQRSHIEMDSPRWIGKETSRHWEQGDDISMVDFTCAEFSDGKVRATEEQRVHIAKIGIKQIARETGIHHETILFIAHGQFVKPRTLRVVARFLHEHNTKKDERDHFNTDKLSDLPDLKEMRDLLHQKKGKKHIALLDKRIRRLELSV